MSSFKDTSNWTKKSGTILGYTYESKGSRRDEADEDDYLEDDLEPIERDVEKTVAKVSRDVQAIRGRVDVFYHAAIVILIVLFISQVRDLLGF
jgi:hypothetical protein